MSARTTAEEILKIQQRDKKIRGAVDAFHRKIGSQFYYLQESEVQRFMEDQQNRIDEVEANISETIKRAPEIMSELMQDFIIKRGINDRAKIRLQMKAILDLISVDTERPVTQSAALPHAHPRLCSIGFLFVLVDGRKEAEIK